MEVNKKKHPQGGESLPTTSNQANAPSQDHIITLEGQMSLFDAPPLKVHNKVRLIELFSGIGAQAKAIESNTQLYAQAGNSIVVNCLVAIFGQMFEGKEEIYKERTG